MIVSPSGRFCRALPLLGWLAAFAALTALTQIGGVIFAVSHIAGHRWHLGRAARASLFCVFYLLAMFVAVPRLAPFFGREALACVDGDHPYRAQSIFYCATGRNYVRPPVKAHLSRIADDLAVRFPGTVVTYLDAGFPFADGFPLPPHLSHRDGRKLDLALFYRDRDPGGAWPIGYWALTPPATSTTPACARDGLFRWNMAWLQPLLPVHQLDVERTRALIQAITATKPQKIFLEPHLVRSLQLEGKGLLFAGCHAARHDDHVHVQWP
jgi:hypothetical protein